MRTFILALLGFGLSGATLTALASDCPGLTVVDPWVREAPPGAKVMAGYMTLVNKTSQPIKLTNVASPGFRSSEFHRMWFEGDQMHMAAQETLEVPARGRLVFEPGGYHIMLFNPEREFRAGDTVSIRLQCGAKKTYVKAPVRRAAIPTDEPEHEPQHHHE